MTTFDRDGFKKLIRSHSKFKSKNCKIDDNYLISRIIDSQYLYKFPTKPEAILAIKTAIDIIKAECKSLAKNPPFDRDLSNYPHYIGITKPTLSILGNTKALNFCKQNNIDYKEEKTFNGISYNLGERYIENAKDIKKIKRWVLVLKQSPQKH